MYAGGERLSDRLDMYPNGGLSRPLYRHSHSAYTDPLHRRCEDGLSNGIYLYAYHDVSGDGSMRRSMYFCHPGSYTTGSLWGTTLSSMSARLQMFTPART